jgi:hypothetical protein
MPFTKQSGRRMRRSASRQHEKQKPHPRFHRSLVEQNGIDNTFPFSVSALSPCRYPVFPLDNRLQLFNYDSINIIFQLLLISIADPDTDAMNHQMPHNGDNVFADETFITVTVLENAVEAQLVASILEEREIRHRIRSHHDTAYDGLFQTQKGWGDLEAPEACRQEIMEIIDQIRSEAARTTDDTISTENRNDSEPDQGGPL